MQSFERNGGAMRRRQIPSSSFPASGATGRTPIASYARERGTRKSIAARGPSSIARPLSSTPSTRFGRAVSSGLGASASSLQFTLMLCASSTPRKLAWSDFWRGR